MFHTDPSEILWRSLNCRMVMGWCRMPNFCGDLDEGARFCPQNLDRPYYLTASDIHSMLGKLTWNSFPWWCLFSISCKVKHPAVWQIPIFTHLCCMRLLFERRSTFPQANHRLRNWNTISLSIDTLHPCTILSLWTIWEISWLYNDIYN